MYKIEYHKKAIKDIEKIKRNKLNNKMRRLIEIISENPFQNPPPYEKLEGRLNDMYLRRINFQHRLVYEILEDRKIVRILSMWTHYEIL